MKPPGSSTSMNECPRPQSFHTPVTTGLQAGDEENDRHIGRHSCKSSRSHLICEGGRSDFSLLPKLIPSFSYLLITLDPLQPHTHYPPTSPKGLGWAPESRNSATWEDDKPNDQEKASVNGNHSMYDQPPFLTTELAPSSTTGDEGTSGSSYSCVPSDISVQTFLASCTQNPSDTLPAHACPHHSFHGSNVAICSSGSHILPFC